RSSPGPRPRRCAGPAWRPNEAVSWASARGGSILQRTIREAGMTTAVAERRQIGELLREWRNRRRISQLELSLQAEVSSRHLSFVETGRSRPSRAMVLRLGDCLGVPLREQSRLMLAAGYAPVFEERPLEAAGMGPVREAVRRILAGHDPYPAVVVDRAWNMVDANGSAAALLEGVDEDLLEPPVNVLRVSLHPKGMAPSIANLGEWRGHLLHRLRGQADWTGDAELEARCRRPPTRRAPRPPAAPGPRRAAGSRRPPRAPRARAGRAGARPGCPSSPPWRPSAPRSTSPSPSWPSRRSPPPTPRPPGPWETPV